jgi:hypothetical protein
MTHREQILTLAVVNWTRSPSIEFNEPHPATHFISFYILTQPFAFRGRSEIRVRGLDEAGKV